MVTPERPGHHRTVRAADGSGELGIRLGGRPSRVLRCYRLDDWHGADAVDVERAAAAARDSLALTVCVATREPPARLQPLLAAATLTLAGPAVDARAWQRVAVDDPKMATGVLAAAVDRCPRAAVAVGQLLRQTARLDTVPGLAAEAAVYSMLLGGPEFAAWLAERGAPRPAPAPARPLVRLERDGSRLRLVLDHPERRNAVSFGMREALLAALDLVDVDDTIESVELSGAGPVFCSGGDLAEFGTATDLVAAYLVRLDRAPWRILDRHRERVAVRVHGAAIGAGIELAAFAGRVLAAPGTYCQLPEIGMGLVPGAGGTVSVPRRIGRWRAAWMMLSGEPIDTGTALSWGLVDAVTEQ